MNLDRILKAAKADNPFIHKENPTITPQSDSMGSQVKQLRKENQNLAKQVKQLFNDNEFLREKLGRLLSPASQHALVRRSK